MLDARLAGRRRQTGREHSPGAGGLEEAAMSRLGRGLLAVAAIGLAFVVGGCLGGRPGQSQGGGATSGTGAGPSAPAVGKATGEITLWTYPQGDEESSLKAYKKAFEEQNPDAKVKILVIPEGDPYSQKINTALRAGKPPDVAIIEDRAWMKSGQVVELTPYFDGWGVEVADFNPGGLARATIDGDVSGPIYAVGDYLGGNILVYNKRLFDAAGVAHPPKDRSLTIQEYADICRKIGKPSSDPATVVYGCSMPEWSIGIQVKDVFGPDGRKAEGNLNSPEMVEAFELGSALIRDRLAPGPSALETLSESDFFAQGRIGITWTDFTEVGKYEEQDISFGLAPFFVIKEGESFVDTWTAAWGTFKKSSNGPAALAFLRFIATDAQQIRLTASEDPPLSTKVAAEANYGEGDPVKQEYLEVLQFAKPQVFVPPGVDAWDPLEVLRLMTIEKQTDAKPILDDQAKKTQKELDETWADWERLGAG
jgi:multiple sugar transport system substrate-binding protein